MNSRVRRPGLTAIEVSDHSGQDAIRNMRLFRYLARQATQRIEIKIRRSGFCASKYKGNKLIYCCRRSFVAERNHQTFVHKMVQTFAAKAWPHGPTDQSLAPSEHDKQIGCCYSMLGLRAAAHIFKNAKSSPACQQLASTTGLPYLQVMANPKLPKNRSICLSLMQNLTNRAS